MLCIFSPPPSLWKAQTNFLGITKHPGKQHAILICKSSITHHTIIKSLFRHKTLPACLENINSHCCSLDLAKLA